MFVHFGEGIAVILSLFLLQRPKRSRKARKGIVYENDANEGEEHPELAPEGDSQPKWKMEFNMPGGLAPGIGVPPSQVMDTGPIGMPPSQVMDTGPIGVPSSQVMDTGPIGEQGTGASAGVVPGPSGSGVTMPRSPEAKFLPSGCLECNCAKVKASPESDRVKRYCFPEVRGART